MDVDSEHRQADAILGPVVLFHTFDGHALLPLVQHDRRVVHKCRVASSDIMSAEAWSPSPHSAAMGIRL